MSEERLSRRAVLGASSAIVAVVTLLVAGLVAGQASKTRDTVDERDTADVELAFRDGQETDSSVPPVDDDVGLIPPVSVHQHDDTAPASSAPAVSPAASPVPSQAPAAARPVAPTTTPSTPATPSSPAPTTTTTALPLGTIISLDDPRLTAEQRAAASLLIERTTSAMQAFPNEAAVIAAGYTSIGDAPTGFEHYVNWSYLTDGNEVDPSHIESIVLRVSGGVKTVESAMYILSFGKDMGDVPDIAGELTTWHNHTNLCFAGTKVVGLAGPDGTCAQGMLVVTPPMLHVWITEQPCGPFAGIEMSGHGSGCHTH